MMRHALRRLRRAPGFAVLVVACLSFGIGVNVALFAVVDTLLFRPPSGVRHPESVRRFVIPLAKPSPNQRFALGRGFARSDLEQMRSHPEAFVAVAAHRPALPSTFGATERRTVTVQAVTGDWFSLLGAAAVHGRPILLSDDRPDAPAVAVLSDRFWRTSLGGDVAVVGRRVRLEGGQVEVVGVASPKFTGLGVAGPDVWIAAARADVIGTPREMLVDPDVEWFSPVVRLAPGVTDAHVASVLAAALRARDATIPSTAWQARQLGGPFRRPVVESLAGRRSAAMPVDGGVDVPGWLFGATVAVLLVTCANAAGLLLARGERRRSELGTRAALGAGKGRLASDLLAESAWLAAGGALFGLVIAGALAQLAGWLPRMPRVAGLEWRSASAAVGLAVLVTFLAGLTPALSAGRTDAMEALKSGTNRVTGRHTNWRSALVAAQLAASVVLLVVGGLFVRSLQAVQRVDVGVDYRRLVEIWAPLDGERLPRATVDALREAAVERVLRVRGARDAAGTMSAPLGGALVIGARVPGRDVSTGAPSGKAFAMAVDERYFSTAGVPILRGRPFERGDREAAAKVVVVSQGYARVHWPNDDPLGQCVELGPQDSRTCATVVGVAGDVRFLSVMEEPPPLLYLPLAQYEERTGQIHILVRTTADPHALAFNARESLRSLDGRLASAQARPVTDGSFAAELAPFRLAAWALGIFSGLALAVATVGLYAAVSYTVEQRSGEVGIRLAIGAQPTQVVRLIVTGIWAPTTAGVAGGIVASLFATRAVGSRLFGVSPWDPITFATVIGVLAAVTLVAAWIPARRAARVAPLGALRS